MNKLKRRDYDYGIRVFHTQEPLDETFPFGARLTFFHRKTGGRLIEVPVYFKEVYARTEHEARDKLRAKVEGWIATQVGEEDT